MTTKRWYRVLNVPANATQVQINLAYKALTGKGDQKTQKNVERAYVILGNPVTRRIYDAKKT